jgi:putative membrane protein
VKKTLQSWLLVSLGILIAAHTSSGIAYDSWPTLILVVIVLSVLNLFLKPLLILFTLPFVILSLGLGIWLINAVLLLLAGNLVPGFFVEGFVSALWGSLVISLTTVVANLLLYGRGKGKREPARDRDVIDI